MKAVFINTDGHCHNIETLPFMENILMQINFYIITKYIMHFCYNLDFYLMIIRRII